MAAEVVKPNFVFDKQFFANGALIPKLITTTRTDLDRFDEVNRATPRLRPTRIFRDINDRACAFDLGAISPREFC